MRSLVPVCIFNLFALLVVIQSVVLIIMIILILITANKLLKKITAILSLQLVFFEPFTRDAIKVV